MKNKLQIFCLVCGTQILIRVWLCARVFSHSLTGRLENIMCSLRMLGNNLFHSQHVLEEVLSLRLQREPSCGGRAVWSCILINRVSQSLSLLQQLLRVDSSVSADNDLAVVSIKRNDRSEEKSLNRYKQTNINCLFFHPPAGASKEEESAHAEKISGPKQRSASVAAGETSPSSPTGRLPVDYGEAPEEARPPRP